MCRIGPVACAVLLTASTSVLANKIAAEQDPSADFSAYRTVAWGEGTPASIARGEAWLVEAIETELRERGLVFVEQDPDLYVVSHALADEHSLEELADETRWEFWTGVRSVRAVDLGVGTLVVDLVDVESERVVWRGLASGAVSAYVDKNRKRVERMIRKLFRRCPLGAE